MSHNKYYIDISSNRFDAFVSLPSGGPPELHGRKLCHLAMACGQGMATATILGKNRAAAPETAFSTVPQLIKKYARAKDAKVGRSKTVFFWLVGHFLCSPLDSADKTRGSQLNLKISLSIAPP